MRFLANGLENIEDVVDRLRNRQKRRHDVFIDDVADLRFRHQEGGVDREDAFVMTVDGVDMPLTDGANQTASAMIKQKNPDWFSRFQDPDYFPKSFRNFSHNTGFLIRHDGHRIQAVLPNTYVVRDSYELLVEDFLPLVEENIGKLQGIGHFQEGDGDLDAFRLICSKNVVDGIDEKYGHYLMFLLSTSENALHDTIAWLGLYRSISASAAIRSQTRTKWSHRNSGERFRNKTSDVVRGMGYYQNSFSKVLTALLNQPLPLGEDGREMDAVDVLTILKDGKMITPSHFAAAKLHANSLTEDGRPHRTQYDLFNACTRGAQDILSPSLRHKAEEVSMSLFTEPGGLLMQIQRAFERTPD